MALNSADSKATQLAGEAAKWKKGRDGELATQAALAAASIPALHDLAPVKDSPANIDHLALTDRLVVIDSKNWSGKFTRSANGVLRQNGYSKTAEINKMSWQERVISKSLIGTCLEGQETEMVMCLVNADWQIDVPWFQTRWVWVVPLENLLELLYSAEFKTRPILDRRRAWVALNGVFEGNDAALQAERQKETADRAYTPQHLDSP